MKNDFIQVFVSCESRQQAKTMVDSLLEAHIIACAQILPKIESFYHWQGQIERSEECLLILKSTGAQFPALQQLVNDLHSYDIPEVVAVPIVAGSPDYLKWINEHVKA